MKGYRKQLNILKNNSNNFRLLLLIIMANKYVLSRQSVVEYNDPLYYINNRDVPELIENGDKNIVFDLYPFEQCKELTLEQLVLMQRNGR